MNYPKLIEGANRYGVGDNIYDLASLMISKNGILSEEAIARVFVLIFSWNRDYYSPPSPRRRKPFAMITGSAATYKFQANVSSLYVFPPEWPNIK